MEEKEISEKLEEFKVRFSKFKSNKVVSWAMRFADLFSSALCALSLLSVLLNILISIGAFSEFSASEMQNNVFVYDIAYLLPRVDYGENVLSSALFSVLYIFIIPIIVGLAVYFVIEKTVGKDIMSNISKLDIQGDDATDTIIKRMRIICPRDRTPDFGISFFEESKLVKILSIIVYLVVSIVVFTHILIPEWGNVALAIIGGIMATVFTCIPFIIVIFIITILFGGLQAVVFCPTQVRRRKMHWEFDNFSKDYEAYKKAKAEAEQKRIEQEAKEKAKREKQERQAKEERERKERQEQAEAEFRELTIDGNEDYNVIEQLAENGSPSACLYIGKKTYSQIHTEKFTKDEKHSLISKATKLLKNAIVEGDVTAEYLNLWLDCYDNSNNCEHHNDNYDKDDWKCRLNKARALFKNNKLEEEYRDDCELLIDNLINIVNNSEDDGSKDYKPTKSTSSTTYTYTPASQKLPNPTETYCRYYLNGLCTHDYPYTKCDGFCVYWHM